MIRRLSRAALTAVSAGIFFALCVSAVGAQAPSGGKPNKTAAGSGGASAVAQTPLGSNERRDTQTIEILCGAGVILVLFPIGRFLLKQWKFRASRLFGELAGDPIVYYYQQFRPGGGPKSAPPVKMAEPVDGNWFAAVDWKPYMDSFCTDFYTWYGRRYYIAPVLMLVVLTAGAACWAQRMLREWAMTAGGPGTSMRALTASALAGAFVWVISDELDRLRRRDFTTNDVYYYIFRILLAVPFAWALSAVQDNDHKIFGVPAAIPIAFFLGTFPTTTLFTIGRRFVTQQLKLGDDQQVANELEKLNAVTKTNAERFRDEGVTTITQLAYGDPVDLTIRTNYDFNYVIDCVSQALAWIYLGDGLSTVTPLSLRGAQEIASVMTDSRNTKDPLAQQLADNTIVAAAALLKIDKDAFRSTLAQIADDPYTIFLVNVWS